MIPNKAHLRRGVLVHRESLSAEAVAKIGEALAQRLWSLPVWRQARLPAMYCSMGGEISTRRILEELFREKRAVALPRIEGSDLRLHRVTSMAQLAPGRFGITEPLADTPAVSESEPDLLLVPGVAFDRRGHRVGYGKGFYDRLLQHTNAPVIALAYGFQLVHHVPEEPHDHPVDYILTPDELIVCGEVPASSHHPRHAPGK